MVGMILNRYKTRGSLGTCQVLKAKRKSPAFHQALGHDMETEGNYLVTPNGVFEYIS